MSFSVLIVDDEKMPRELLKHYIPWETLQVEYIYEADDGEAALELVRERKPDIIISDIKMPRMSGMALAEAVRTIHPACKFIFLSAYPDKEYLKEAIKLKAASFVEKPIDPEEVLAALSDIVKELASSRPVDKELLFFRGRTEGAAGLPLNAKSYSLPPDFYDKLDEMLKTKDRHGLLMLLTRLYRELQQNEGTGSGQIRQIYCQIVFRLLSFARLRNYTLVTDKGNACLYAAASLETLKEIHDAVTALAEVYFEAVSSDAPDPQTRVNRYIEENYGDPELSVQAMAQDLGFTNTYLCSAYKKSSGNTINQQITRVRLEHSKELLPDPSLRLYDIAAAVGYADSNYFTRLFTREYGLTPKEYRERHCHEI